MKELLGGNCKFVAILVMVMGRSSVKLSVFITRALRVSGIHWKSGFETGRSSDPSTFVSSKTPRICESASA